MAACKGCGIDIQEGAFLGMCPACAKGDARTAPTSAAAPASGNQAAKRMVIIGVGVAALISFLMVFLFMGAPSSSRSDRVSTNTVEAPYGSKSGQKYRSKDGTRKK